MGPADEQLLRQVLAMLLYSRRFHRASRPALDVFSSVLEAVMMLLWRQAASFARMTDCPVSLPVVMNELLRTGKPFYLDRRELLEYEGEQPEGEAGSVMEERGLLNAQLRVLAGTRVDEKLHCIVVDPSADAVENPNRNV
ncbi:hypothetical protein PSACC_02426 [Paramicrosporidium saccamoebae]|uniref:Uncharacterized protein n=1 Tax=Paramicrosporidium saccamoebae TaxID=1246581 RepID=A0A2H9TJ38_9FUNG|nr:hypothetical protein PSACC_02426 [Paramicrosporidium saccamoebae]